MATRARWQDADLPPMETGLWGWFAGLGAALMLLGFIASANLILATLAATYAVGALMFAGGILQLVHAFAVRRWAWSAFWTLSGLLYLAAAAVVLYDPLFAARLLTLLLAVALGASGVVRAGIAIAWRGYGWGWMLMSGLISCALAAMIANSWPANVLWLLGLVLAVDLMVQGVMLMLIGFTLRAACLRSGL